MIYIDNTQLIATIKELQLRKNYTQKQLATAIGISPANLSNILKNKKSLTFEDVNKICNALGYKLDYSFIDTDNTSKEDQ
jgi:transcriptional regulator with XRE-family HTH domain